MAIRRVRVPALALMFAAGPLLSCGSSADEPDDGAGPAMDAAPAPRDARAPIDAPALRDAPGEELDATSGEDDGGVRRDRFGVAELYPSAPGGREWTSAHWDGGPYELTARIDPRDPSGLSGRRGSGTLSVREPGVLTMAGSQPRLYVYPPDAEGWRDVEVTLYYRRNEDAATPYAGVVVGTRSGADGHTVETPCDAHTYYARLRNDGTADFAKELHHPNASARGRVPAATLWPDAPAALPSGVWIGFKLVVRNLGDGSVALEMYRDRTEGAGGGAWERIAETVDDGTWTAASTCPEHAPVDGSSTMIQRGGGTVLVRNTEVSDVEYRWITIREIAAP